MSHNLVRLAERHALFRQVIGHIGSGKVAFLRLCHHRVFVNGHGGNHACRATIAILQRLCSVNGAFLVFLQVLVVRQRKRLHGHQQRHQITDNATRFSTNELSEVGVLFLRHNG